MDARDFVKLSVAGLGLRINLSPGSGSGSTAGGAASPWKRRGRARSWSGRVGIPASSGNCFFCEIKFPGCQPQIAQIPLVFGEPDSRSLAASFYIDAAVFSKILSPSPASCLLRMGTGSAPALELVVCARPGYSISSSSSKILGVFRVGIGPDVDWAEGVTLHGGWVKMDSVIGGMELHSIVKLESDPRYEFQFDGDIALSPQIVQVKGNGAGKKQQPVFSCKFSKGRTRMVQGDLTPSRTPREETSSSGSSSRERKSWLVTIHDLSGSPIAAASMVTPFVPFTGSDEVSRSNPGGWLILVPDSFASATDVVHGGHSYFSWRAWGRLEAWRQDGGKLGLKFQLISHTGAILVSETTIPSSNKPGEFSIDTGPGIGGIQEQQSPLPTPRSSGDCSFYLGLPTTDSGFVMNCELRRGKRGGSGRGISSAAGSSSSSRATVQLSTKYITCVEDAAVFMALAAAVDLSRDACQPFSRKLRKELCREVS